VKAELWDRHGVPLKALQLSRKEPVVRMHARPRLPTSFAVGADLPSLADMPKIVEYEFVGVLGSVAIYRERA
jgi:hypothetical protein